VWLDNIVHVRQVRTGPGGCRDADGKAVTGDPSEVSNWVGYGAKVMVVADGVVLASLDDLEDQVPGELPDPSTMNLENVDGNYVVIDHGDGLYSFYAHFQSGNVEVEVRDEVQAGDQLGLLGNTGNTSAPHLHFHMVGGPSPIASDGFPYVTRQWSCRCAPAPSRARTASRCDPGGIRDLVRLKVDVGELAVELLYLFLRERLEDVHQGEEPTRSGVSSDANTTHTKPLRRPGPRMTKAYKPLSGCSTC
jgi:murein DD-endopeptidase MepM/ murein hydrolase activator NlpD